MTEQQLQELVEKASNGTIVPEEELELLKELNSGASALDEFLGELKKLDEEDLSNK